MRIAVDAMGGDSAPEAPVAGAVQAVQAEKGKLEVVLVGDEARITAELNRLKVNAAELGISIAHASQSIDMDESPASALKKKPDSSIAKAQVLHRDGKADAVVSAGHTGAAMASALLTLGRIRGVRRPAIGSFIPSENGVTFLIDVGANVDVKPLNIQQFAIMGSIFLSRLIGINEPKVGLLSIGEERKKGNELTQKSFELIEATRLNFIGNVEGKDILATKADVVVCDGFVGNILLKFAEGLIGVFGKQIKESIQSGLMTRLGALLMKPAFASVKKLWNYEEYGGVPLLGVNGVVIICHGRSTPKAIANAIYEARDMVEQEVNRRIKEKLDSLRGMEIVSENT